MTAVRLLQPVPGQVVPITDVPDPVFSQQILGPGVAVEPPAGLAEATIVAPTAGEVTVLYRTGHAAVITSPDSLQVLVHVGIDTVSISSGFTPLIAQGETVVLGQPLIRVDLAALREAGRPTTTVVVVMSDPQAQIELFQD